MILSRSTCCSWLRSSGIDLFSLKFLVNAQVFTVARFTVGASWCRMSRRSERSLFLAPCVTSSQKKEEGMCLHVFTISFEKHGRVCVRVPPPPLFFIFPTGWVGRGPEGE